MDLPFQVSNLMFTLYCGHDSKESFQVQGLVYDNMLVFKVGPLAVPQSLETTLVGLCNVWGPNFIQQLLFATSCCTPPCVSSQLSGLY